MGRGKTNGENKGDLLKLFAIGAALSAIAGYVAGILTAPKSGKETRADIKDKAGATYTAAERQLKTLHTELTDLINEISNSITTFKNRKEVSDALDKGRDVKQKAREVLSVLHDGEADDKDLKKAIQDATDAIEHLRNYLKK
jgi:gas vesicle protein